MNQVCVNIMECPFDKFRSATIETILYIPFILKIVNPFEHKFT